jgi:ribonuclease R
MPGRSRSARSKRGRATRRAVYHGYPGSGDFLWEEGNGRLHFFPQLVETSVSHGDVVRFLPGARNRSARVLGVDQRSGIVTPPSRWDDVDIRREFGLPGPFPGGLDRRPGDDLLPPLAAGSGREDLTSLFTFTIDPADARDHDDAVSIQQEGNELTLGVHIADVAEYVVPGTPLDREALSRASSVYLKDGVVPMLPHYLSSDLCSLVEGKPRLTMSTFLTYDRRGRLQRTRLTPGIIRSRARLSYDEAQSLLDRGRSRSRLASSLKLMHRLAGTLRDRRNRQGSLNFEMHDLLVVLSESGDPVDLVLEEHLSTHWIIEEFMLAANRAVALRLHRGGFPLLWRVHAQPDFEKVQGLKRTLRQLGVVWDPSRPVRVKDYQGLVELIRGRPEERVLTIFLLQSLMKAEYTPEHDKHFGLGFRYYTHFTSPIRRYPDLFNHRLLKQALGFPVPGADSLRPLTTHGREIGWICSDRERWAESAERASAKEKLCVYLKRYLGNEYEGTISGMKRIGFFVMVDEFWVEGLVPIRSVRDDRYRFDRQKNEWVGVRHGRRFFQGMRVRVQLVRVDEDRRFIDFNLVERKHSGGGPTRKRRRRKRS